VTIFLKSIFKVIILAKMDETLANYVPTLEIIFPLEVDIPLP
jgi:hypothetical protein